MAPEGKYYFLAHRVTNLICAVLTDFFGLFAVFRHEDYNECVDIYSYAMILFYLVVGRPPWPNLAGLDAVRKASEEGDRPTIPRDLDQRLQNLIKECWDENPRARPPFSAILDVLAKYSRDAFHQDSNDVLTPVDSKCGGCVIQ